jgi:hypothetical protein
LRCPAAWSNIFFRASEVNAGTQAANYLYCASGSWVQMLRSEPAFAWLTLQG